MQRKRVFVRVLSGVARILGRSAHMTCNLRSSGQRPCEGEGAGGGWRKGKLLPNVHWLKGVAVAECTSEYSEAPSWPLHIAKSHVV